MNKLLDWLIGAGGFIGMILLAFVAFIVQCVLSVIPIVIGVAVILWVIRMFVS